MKSIILKAKGRQLVPEDAQDVPLAFTANHRGGYSPVEMTVYSAGACALYVYRKILKDSKVDAKVDRVKMEYMQAPERPQFITSITLKFYVTADDDHAEQRAETCLKFVHQYCPVIQSLSDDIVITDELIFVE